MPATPASRLRARTQHRGRASVARELTCEFNILGYLIGQLASRATSRVVNGMSEVHLRFDH